jgi:NAD+ synthase
MLADAVRARQPDATEENIQSRMRGVTLMALSNKFGHDGPDDRQQVGDGGRLCDPLWRHECGGYNALKDIYKTEVFELARWRKWPCLARAWPRAAR